MALTAAENEPTREIGAPQRAVIAPTAIWRMPRSPLVPVVTGVAAGIWVDATLVYFETEGALAFAAIAALISFAGTVRDELRWSAAPALLVAFFTLGAGWHHARCEELPPDDVARFAWTRPTPGRIRGTIADVPAYFAPDPDWHDDHGRTRLRVAMRALHDGREWRASSGRIIVDTVGERADLKMGAPIEAAGVLERFRSARNPGESSSRDRWSSEGARVRMFVDDRTGVAADSSGRAEHWDIQLGQMRAASSRALDRELDPDTAAITRALLLGERDDVDRDVSDAFMRTGTMHLLAISGLHMHALAVLIGGGLLLVGVAPRRCAVLVALCVVAYAVLVGLRPSVIRSAAMTTVACVGILASRPTQRANLLALAGLVTLVANPAFLFDAGWQLSFLSVAALFWCVPLVAGAFGLLENRRAYPSLLAALPRATAETAGQALDRVERALRPRWRRACDGMVRAIVVAALGSLVITLVNAPLTAHWFHMISWSGILLNVPLVALSAPTLCVALLALATAFFGGWPAALTAKLCSGTMGLTVATVKWGAAWPFGYAHIAAPGTGWNLVFYALICASCILAFRGMRRLASCAVAAIVVWCCAGIVSVGLGHAPSHPTAHVLAVDHGLSVVVQSPSGKTLLYDCGSMRAPRVGRQVIAPALWALGVRQIDLAVISHADADHYSGLLDLLDRFAIHAVGVPPEFGGIQNPEAEVIVAECGRRGVPVMPLALGARIDLGAGMVATVLHPSSEFPKTASDNARSVVLDVSVGGRSLLLTGDVEGAGLDELLSTPPRAVEVLLAPHHGGRASNPPGLFEWAQPRVVIASQKRVVAGGTDALAAIEQGGVHLRRTWQDGAIGVHWELTGVRVTSEAELQDARIRRPTLNQLMESMTDLLSAPPAWAVPVLAIVALLVGFACAVAIAVIEWGGWTLVAPSRRLTQARLATPLPDGARAVTTAAHDGATLCGWFIEASDSDPPVVLLCHGFAEYGTAMFDRAADLKNAGFGVLVIDNRARGQSGGDFCTFGAIEAEDMKTWLNVVDARVPASRRIVWGRSMGAAIALAAAARDPRVEGVVLEAPYATLVSSVAAGLRRKRLPGWLAGPMLRRAERIVKTDLRQCDPMRTSSEVNVPVFMLCGSDDAVAPLGDSREIAARLGGGARLEVVEAGHHDVYTRAGAEQKEALIRWIRGLG